MDIVIPWDLTGVINDQNVDDISRAIYGEMYFDLSDDTKLTVGARYQDDEVVSTIYNDTAAWFIFSFRLFYGCKQRHLFIC